MRKALIAILIAGVVCIPAMASPLAGSYQLRITGDTHPVEEGPWMDYTLLVQPEGDGDLSGMPLTVGSSPQQPAGVHIFDIIHSPIDPVDVPGGWDYVSDHLVLWEGPPRVWTRVTMYVRGTGEEEEHVVRSRSGTW